VIDYNRGVDDRVIVSVQLFCRMVIVNEREVFSRKCSLKIRKYSEEKNIIK